MSDDEETAPHKSRGLRGRGAGSSKKRSETYNIYIYKVGRLPNNQLI